MKHLGVFCALACALMAFAARAAPPLEAYGKLPALEFVSLSPSGDRIAFVSTDGEKRRLFVRTVGGDAIMSADVGSSKIRNLHWAGEKNLVVLVSATVTYGTGTLDNWDAVGRAELWAMLAVDVEHQTARKIFEGHETDVVLGAIDADYGAWNQDGQWYEFVRGFSRQGRREHVYKVELSTGRYIDMTPEVADNADYIVSDGAVGLHARYDQPSKTFNAYLGRSGREAIVSRVTPLATTHMRGLGRTKNTVLILDERDGRYVHDEYPLAPNATPTPLFVGEEIGSLIRDPVSGVLLGGLSPDGQSGIFFDPKLQAHFDAVKRAFRGYVISLESWSTDLRRMVVMTSGGDDPGTYWLVDTSTGKADELMSARPAIAQVDVGPTRTFAYKAGDGLALEGVLTLPPGREAKGLPLVVLPHDGPLGMSDHVGFDWRAQAFASRGYAVLQPNYRGSSGYGLAFREKGYGEWGRKMLSDMTDGVQALAASGIIDRNRTCIVGTGEYGGYAALAAVTLVPSPFRCAVALSGISEVRWVLGIDNVAFSASARFKHQLFGLNDFTSPRVEEISPLEHATKASAPILLIHGKDDTVVSFRQSLFMHDSLDRAGRPNKLVILDQEDHWLSREATRTQAVKESVGWVMENNPPN